MLEQIRAAAPSDIARVTETRYGILQHLPDASPGVLSLAWYGEYLQAQLDLLSGLIGPGAHVVEAGSGIGEHAIALAKMVDAHGQVWIYETRPVVRQILRQNLDVNRAASNVTLMRRALAGPDTESDELADTARPMHAESRVDTLDALHLARLDLLKIRHDSAAADILAGAGATLWRLRPMLFIAAANDAAVTDLAALVRQFGYRCWRHESSLFNPGNFLQRDTDIFAGETALALLAIPEEAEVATPLDRCVELAGVPDIGRTDTNARPGLMEKLRKLLP